MIEGFEDCTITYKKEYFKEILMKYLDEENVEYGVPNEKHGGYGYIDDSFSTVFDCIVKAFEETTESKMK